MTKGFAMRSMRSVITAVLLATTMATPALARPGYDDGSDRDIARAAERFNDPRMQRAMGGAMMAMMDAMLDIRVDKLRDAIDRVDDSTGRSARDDGDWRDRDGREARTLRDLVSRDDPNFSEHMAAQTQHAMRTMGVMATTMADMAPQMRDIAERVARQMEDAMRRAR